MASTQTVDTKAVSRAMTNATTAASHAPSIHDTRPWRWRAHGDHLDLSVDGSRTPAGADLDRRLAILSCGAALHHALISLAADGRHTTVTRLPDLARPGHLATFCVGGRIPVELSAVCLKATESGISVGSLSSSIEVTATREIVRHLLPGPGHPYLVLRFGVLDSAASGPPRTPGLLAEQIVAQP